MSGRGSKRRGRLHRWRKQIDQLLKPTAVFVCRSLPEDTAIELLHNVVWGIEDEQVDERRGQVLRHGKDVASNNLPGKVASGDGATYPHCAWRQSLPFGLHAMRLYDFEARARAWHSPTGL